MEKKIANKKKKAASKLVAVRCNEADLRVLNWYTKKTGRKAGNAMKWELLQASISLGYVPPK